MNDDSTKASASGEAYLDIVWRQFKKNTSAYVSLWCLAPVYLLAIFAPAIASNQPFVYRDGDKWLFPWWNSLFNPDVPIDFPYNMALLGFFPWLVIAVATNVIALRRNVPGRRRLGFVIGEFLAILLVLCAIFSIPQLRPSNKYWARSFVKEEFEASARNTSGAKQTYGIYPLIPFGPIEDDLESSYRPPLFRAPPELRDDLNDGRLHVLGTDSVGRDVLTQMIYGTRIAISIGFVAVGIYLSIGVVVGAIAGYFGGLTDMLISRVIEVVLLFPAFFLILTMVALLGPSIYIIMVVIGLTSWPTIARLIRGEVLKQRAIDYCIAARGLGASHYRILFRHVLPNSISPALVAAPFGIANAIIIEAGLTLLGFGVRPPAPSWGTLLRMGRDNYNYWWLIVIPSIAIFLAVTIFNLVGNGARDAMDPRLRV
jgi:peptide/nickel transport system permease protein